MESYVWWGMKSNSQNTELDRKYRLAKQFTSMHFSLRDSYRFWSSVSEIILLIASTVFLSTTFADSSLFQFFGLDPQYMKIALGVASVIAFICSLTLLLLRWPEKAVQHKKAAQKWSNALTAFRDTRLEDKTWPPESHQILNDLYSTTTDNTAAIPDKKFNNLKAQYLLKVEISKLLSKYPGAPRFLLYLLVRLSGTYKALLKK